MKARITVFSILLLDVALGVANPVFLNQTEKETIFAKTEQSSEIGEDNTGKEAAFSLAMVPEYSGIAYADINDDVPFFMEDELTAKAFHEYWELDELGHCTGAYACIGPEILPMEDRVDISEVRPSGWHSVQYEIVDGGSSLDRLPAYRTECGRKKPYNGDAVYEHGGDASL